MTTEELENILTELPDSFNLDGVVYRKDTADKYILNAIALLKNNQIKNKVVERHLLVDLRRYLADPELDIQLKLYLRRFVKTYY